MDRDKVKNTLLSILLGVLGLSWLIVWCQRKNSYACPACGGMVDKHLNHLS